MTERTTGQLIEGLMRDSLYLADRLRARGVEVEATKARAIGACLELFKRTRAIRDAERAEVEQSGELGMRSDSENRIARLERDFARASGRIERLEYQLHHTLATLEAAEQAGLDAAQGRLDQRQRAIGHFDRRDEFKALRCGAQAVAGTPRPNQPPTRRTPSNVRRN